MINIGVLLLIKTYKKESSFEDQTVLQSRGGESSVEKHKSWGRYVHFKCVPCVPRVTWFTQNICSHVKNRTHNLHACASSVQTLQEQISTLLKKNITEMWALEFALTAWWLRMRVRRKARDKNWDSIFGGLCRCYESCTCPAVVVWSSWVSSRSTGLIQVFQN